MPITKKNLNWWYVLIMLVIPAGYLMLYLVQEKASFCVFKAITGIPCPGCGMGRATTAFIHGNFAKATLFHPLAIPFNLFLIVAFFWAFYDLASKKTSFYQFLTSNVNRVVMVAIVTLFAILWAYNIWRGI